MTQEKQSSGSSAWAWATVGIVFIVFYFGNDRGRNSRDSREVKSTSLSSRLSENKDGDKVVVVESNSGTTVVRASRSKPPTDLLGSDSESADDSDASKNASVSIRGQGVSDSIRWLSRSVEALGNRLTQLSEDIDSGFDEEQIENEVKQAVREAFTESNQAEINSDVAFDSLPPAPAAPAPPEPAPSLPASLDAEVPVVDGASLGLAQDLPILGSGTPEWIRERIIREDQIQLPIESSMFSSLQECREELDAKLEREVYRALNAHALHHATAESIPELTSTYIREHLITPDLEFDNFQERPSGTFHQLWVRLDVDAKELTQIHEWERAIVTQDRVWTLSGLAGAVFGTLAGLSGVVSFAAKRERERLSKKATA